MSEQTKDGGPAFPGPGEIFLDGPQGRYLQNAWGAQGAVGMTLRDWFAGKAMQGIMASCPNGISIWSEASYKVADAMLAERSK